MLRSRMALLALALVPAGALAAPTNQVRALRQEVAALQLDHALNLTRSQAQALLPLIRDAKAKVEALKAQREASQPAVAAALAQAVADLKAMGTVSEATLEALKAARGGAFGALRQDMGSFWQGARQILTPDQLQALKSARLGIRPAAPAGAAWADGGKDHRPGRRFRVMHALLSDPFVALVQARAG